MPCQREFWSLCIRKRFFSKGFAISRKLDETIRGHLFCSFIAPVLKKGLENPHRRARSLGFLARESDPVFARWAGRRSYSSPLPPSLANHVTYVHRAENDLLVKFMCVARWVVANERSIF